MKRFLYKERVDEIHPVDLVANLETVVLLLKSEWSSGIEIVRQFDSNPVIGGHATQLFQVWSNLILNAIHAMQGKGTLTLSLTTTDSDVLVTVEDTGSGIPEALQKRIFDPFFTTKKMGEGAGLGLGIVQEILSRHGGVLTFESRPGNTCFRVRLPLSL